MFFTTVGDCIYSQNECVVVFVEELVKVKNNYN